MRVSDGRLIIEVHLRRLFVRLAILAVIGALIAGWTVLRNNGLLGGLDHNGPLDAFSGGRAGLACTSRNYEMENDDLPNLGDSPITIDRVTLHKFVGDGRVRVTEPQIFPITPKAAIQKTNKHAPPPRRPAAGTVIPGHGVSGISYFVRFMGPPVAQGTTESFGIEGETVDYHVGSRHFREETGVEVTMTCHGPKSRPRS
jgi:hypothetical protein